MKDELRLRQQLVAGLLASRRRGQPDGIYVSASLEKILE
jgi:hypothetical protein